MATNISKPTVTCRCGSTVQQNGLTQHHKTTKHRKWVNREPTEHLKPGKFVERLPAELPNLNKGLRYTSKELRTRPRVNAIQALRADIDPYTLENIVLKNEGLPTEYDVDHIHEVQVLVYAIKHTSQLSFRAVERLRTEINDVSNLVITHRSVNRSKGQAIKYFLSHFDTQLELPLLAALVQTSTGGKRQIAQFSRRIAGVIDDTREAMSNHIREIRQNDGHTTGSNEYASVANQFDTVTKAMRLDWEDGITLRSGATYHPPPK
jgi:hypothetical protein